MILNIGGHDFDCLVAQTSKELNRGLMYVDSLSINEGMLFIMPAVEPASFWMLNTPLSLDMIFIDPNGVIVKIHEGATPFSMGIISSTYPVKYVVELLHGAVALNDIKVGDVVKIPCLD